MNDLAEMALHGLGTARRQVLDHPATSVAVAGFVVSSLVVAAGGAVAAVQPTRTLSAWLGLQTAHGLTPTTSGSLLLVGLTLLVGLWLLVVEVVRRRELTETLVWRIVTAAAVPFVLGPPIMDTDSYTSAAFGLIQRAGGDPTLTPPSSLGDIAIVGAIDPSARGTVSASGPLGSLLQHLAVSVGGGTPLGSVILLRVMGLIAAVAIGRLAADLATRDTAASLDSDAEDGATDTARRRPVAIVLCALNPLVLLYVISSPHLEGPMLALVLASLVAMRHRRWLIAVVAASLAAAVLAQAFVVVTLVVVAHLHGRRRSSRARVLVRDIGAAAAVTLVVGVVQPDGFGWIGAVSQQFSTHTPFSVPYAVARVLTPVVAGASYDDLVTSGRISAAVAAGCAVVYLLFSARYRSTQRTAGLALLTMALLAPNLFPWYLLWGVVCLAPGSTGERRTVVVALSVAGCVLLPPGFGSTASNVVTAVGLVVVGGTASVMLRRRARLAAPA